MYIVDGIRVDTEFCVGTPILKVLRILARPKIVDA